MKESYVIHKAAIIIWALFIAGPVFAQANQGGMPPPPPPQDAPLMQGQPMVIQGRYDGLPAQAGMGSTTPPMRHGGPMRPAGDMGTSTNGRPPMPQGQGEYHGGMMGSSTLGMPPQNGTSTPPMPSRGIAGFFAHLGAFFHMGGPNASSTPPNPPMMDGGYATTTLSASSTPPAPPRGVMGFLQHLFGFFH